jgi:hypothetical protein
MQKVSMKTSLSKDRKKAKNDLIKYKAKCLKQGEIGRRKYLKAKREFYMRYGTNQSKLLVDAYEIIRNLEVHSTSTFKWLNEYEAVCR